MTHVFHFNSTIIHNLNTITLRRNYFITSMNPIDLVSHANLPFVIKKALTFPTIFPPQSGEIAETNRHFFIGSNSINFGSTSRTCRNNECRKKIKVMCFQWYSVWTCFAKRLAYSAAIARDSLEYIHRNYMGTLHFKFCI